MILAAFAISATALGAPQDAPFISEIMFNVPKGETGDANKDGSRDATADEFIELHNPTAQPINLAGYTITSRLSTGDPEGKSGIRFTFPEFDLPPYGMVVVFNGYDATIPGPLGTQESVPDGSNPEFAGAYVFSMDNTRRNIAFANKGDFCLLSDPDGHPIDCVLWGEPDPAPPESVDQMEVPKNPKGSVQRADPKAEFHPHQDINDRPCSPGEIPPAHE